MSPDLSSYRLTPLVPGDMNVDQRAIYEKITGGPRARGQQHFRLVEDDGSLTGPFDAMLHSPPVGMSLQQLGAALRYRSALDPRDRELAILTVAAARTSSFEWYAHEGAARAMGLTGRELEHVKTGDLDRLPQARDRAVARACRELAGERRMTDSTWRSLEPWMPYDLVVDLIVLVGYYDLLALLMDALQSPLPRDVGAPFAH